MPTYLAITMQLSAILDSRGEQARYERNLNFAGTPAIIVATGNLQPGNNAAAAHGTAVHNSAEWGEHLNSLDGQYQRNTAINRGKIPDAIKDGQFPVELKPDTWSRIRRGTRDLRTQMRVMGVQYGELWVYRSGPDGLTFRLAAVPRSAGRWNRW